MICSHKAVGVSAVDVTLYENCPGCYDQAEHICEAAENAVTVKVLNSNKAL